MFHVTLYECSCLLFLNHTYHKLHKMSTTKPLGPFKLVTVNTAPERAYRLIGRVVENVKDKYTIIHAGNADSRSTDLNRW
jgi:hypothetical protein